MKEILYFVLVGQSLLLSIVFVWSTNIDTNQSSDCVISVENEWLNKENRKTASPTREIVNGYNRIDIMAVHGDPEVSLIIDEVAAISSEDDIHIRSCFYQDGQITCLVDIRKTIIYIEPIILCPDNIQGEVIGIKQNEYRANHLPHLINHFAKIICPCKDKSCSNYEKEIENQSFSLTQINTNQTWLASLTTHNKPPSYKYRFCSVTGVLRNKPVGMDIWLKHHWESGVEHMFMYAADHHFPTQLYSTLKEQLFIEEIIWHPHYSLDQTYDLGKHMAFLDAVYRYRGLCKWTLFFDTDDYFWHPEVNHTLSLSLEREIIRLGRIPETFLLSWWQTYPSCGLLRSDEGLLYSAEIHESIGNTKMITQTDHLFDLGVHVSLHPDSVPVRGAKCTHFRFFDYDTSKQKCNRIRKQHEKRNRNKNLELPSNPNQIPRNTNLRNTTQNKT